MIRIIPWTCLLFTSANSFAQVVLDGKLVNKATKEPVPYANIGIPKSNVGTISNLDGSFGIRVPESLRNDTIVFSALGFKRRTFTVRHLTSLHGGEILLEEEVIELDPVLVGAKRVKNKTFELGNSSFKGGVLETDTLYAGRSVSLLIDGKDQKDMEFPVYLEKASLRIFKNNLASLKFRVRLNAVNRSSGAPGEDILKQSIVIESQMRSGWLEFELGQLDLLMKEPFFVTFEQILDLKDRTAIADGYRKFIHDHPDKVKIDTVEFEGKKGPRSVLKGSGIDLPGTFVAIGPSKDFTSFVRETSLGEWTKVRGIVTATVIVSTQGGKK